EKLNHELQDWIHNTCPNWPIVYVSFGSFYWIRTDVLIGIVNALRTEPFRVVLAHGATDPKLLGSIPEHWYVGRYLPQTALLPYCSLVVCHGGNNTVTEALTAGVPLLVGPFSSDQFGSAADVELFGLGAVFDPNKSTGEEIRALAHKALQAKQVT